VSVRCIVGPRTHEGSTDFSEGIYRVSQEERSVPWEDIASVTLTKKYICILVESVNLKTVDKKDILLFLVNK
jgi:hypothetical protein